MRFAKKKIIFPTFFTLLAGAFAANSVESDTGKISEPVTRSLSFAAAADPQFSKNTKNARVGFQNDIAKFLLAKLYKDESYKGLIIAGDLTENTYEWEILRFYNALLPDEETELSPIVERRKELDRLYEGIGNHDMRRGSCCANAGASANKDLRAGADTKGNCVCENGLIEIIDRGDRQDQLRSQSPHYSWEWEGIRFVQLNLLPADEAETVWNGASRDPQDALQFLKDELEDAGPDKNVIVIHHYGMDKFSQKWWSAETKDAYKEVIEDFRVIAIVSGHLHWTRNSSNMQQCWNGVTAVTVGSIRLGLYLDFKIEDDHLTVSRMVNGRPRWSDSYSIAQSNTNFCGTDT